MRDPLGRLFPGLPHGVRVALDWVLTIAGAILIVLAIKHWVVNPYRIPSSSMEPTLHCARPAPGCEASYSDRVLANRFVYRYRDPKRGEIIVFNTPPLAAVRCGEGGTFVKRLIGLPGETRESLEETRRFLQKHLIDAPRRVQHKVDLCSYIPMAGTPIFKAVMRGRSDGMDVDEEFDSYGYHPGESATGFDLQWNVDAALMDDFFYEPENLDGQMAPDEIFYKGRRGAGRQIVTTSELTRGELQKARDEMETAVRTAGISY